MNGKVVPGIGGGVCQVSSTLYEAALFAGLGIVERQGHSMAVSYLPPGRDATCYYRRSTSSSRTRRPGRFCCGLKSKAML